MEKQSQTDHIENRELAVRVLEACRNQLFFEYRFLEQALFRLEWKTCENICFGSDGQHLFYAPAYILKRYMEEPGQMMLDYLHLVMHCLYQHPFFAPGVQSDYWDLAADISVECLLLEILQQNAKMAAGKTEQMRSRQLVVERIHRETGAMSVQKIFAFLYRNMSDGQLLEGMDVCELHGLFHRDDHVLWYAKGSESEQDDMQEEPKDKDTIQEEPKDKDVIQEERQDKDAMQEERQDKDAVREGPQDKKAGKAEFADSMDRGNGLGNEQAKLLSQMWKDIASRVLMEAQSFEKPRRGEIAGSLIRSLQPLVRENYDYSEFLLKFAARLEERMQMNEDEFDYIFYTYGLRLFKRVPLIEPLEYKEKYLIHEFVVAIDTSESCEAELVNKFLIKTYNILRQTETFTSRVNIHIIQCDAEIQEDTKIESQKDLEAYISHLTLKGFGGTDFCPVFEYTDHLLETGELRRVDGLIYFTDGYGRFPKALPRYKTAFVFLNRDDDVKVPAWAMKVYLDEEAMHEY